ncbi:cytochrome P450 oxidoreductase [Fusarium oxysporum f. sp. albedinis]|nr:cytochrome P450 oxidoreductase [Fusarium oxysporum f. sp. albedinis]
MLSSMLLLAATAVAILVFRALMQAYTSTKRNIPGPFLAKFSRLWYLSRIWTRQCHLEMINLHKQYGPLVQVAPNEYSVSDPEAIKAIYGHGTRFTKSLWYSAFGVPGHANLFADHIPQRHAQRRRQLASMYSMSNLIHYEPAAMECAALLKERFHEIAQERTAIDLHHWVQCFAFDVITSITCGKRIGFLNNGVDEIGAFATLNGAQAYSSLAGVYYELHPLMFNIQQFFSNFGLGGNGLQAMIDFSEVQVKKRQVLLKDIDRKPAPSDDFLAKILARHEESPESFSMDEVLDSCAMNLIAGSDTTAISLTAIVWFLIKNPQTLCQLREEIDAKMGEQEEPRPLPFKETQTMPYLQAVIKEAIRLHSPAGISMARIVPEGGATIVGHYLPEGTAVGVNPWVTHIDPNVYGPDAQVFRPERWIDSDPEQLKRMERSWMPFGHGSRTCIGKNISILEISVLVPQLVCHFDFKLVHPEQELVCDNIFLVKQKNIFCYVTDRVEL